MGTCDISSPNFLSTLDVKLLSSGHTQDRVSSRKANAIYSAQGLFLKVDYLCHYAFNLQQRIVIKKLRIPQFGTESKVAQLLNYPSPAVANFATAGRVE